MACRSPPIEPSVIAGLDPAIQIFWAVPAAASGISLDARLKAGHDDRSAAARLDVIARSALGHSAVAGGRSLARSVRRRCQNDGCRPVAHELHHKGFDHRIKVGLKISDAGAVGVELEMIRNDEFVEIRRAAGSLNLRHDLVNAKK
jgi:hypothetical protein